jgi:hypothetical protein
MSSTNYIQNGRWRAGPVANRKAPLNWGPPYHRGGGTEPALPHMSASREDNQGSGRNGKSRGPIRKTTRAHSLSHLRRDLGRGRAAGSEAGRLPLLLPHPTESKPPHHTTPHHAPQPNQPLRPAKLAREAADASARKRKAADGGEAAPDAATTDSTPAPPIPAEAVEDAAMGDIPQAPYAADVGAEGEGVPAVPDPNPSPSLGGCSDPVSVELSMGGDYYRSCCGEPDLDIPEGPKLPCVGDKVRAGVPLFPHHPPLPLTAITDWLAPVLWNGSPSRFGVTGLH